MEPIYKLYRIRCNNMKEKTILYMNNSICFAIKIKDKTSGVRLPLKAASGCCRVTKTLQRKREEEINRESEYRNPTMAFPMLHQV